MPPRRNRGMQLNLAINYSGRAEIVDAVKALVEDAARERALPSTKPPFRARLYTAGMPDPDLLIRTSGEMRVSNFLLWQIAYAELYVTETLWPDFSRAELLRAILDYQKRDRRFGGLGDSIAGFGDVAEPVRRPRSAFPLDEAPGDCAGPDPVVVWLILIGPQWAFSRRLARDRGSACVSTSTISIATATQEASSPQAGRGMAAGLALLFAPEPLACRRARRARRNDARACGLTICRRDGSQPRLFILGVDLHLRRVALRHRTPRDQPALADVRPVGELGRRHRGDYVGKASDATSSRRG